MKIRIVDGIGQSGLAVSFSQSISLKRAVAIRPGTRESFQIDGDRLRQESPERSQFRDLSIFCEGEENEGFDKGVERRHDRFHKCLEGGEELGCHK